MPSDVEAQDLLIPRRVCVGTTTDALHGERYGHLGTDALLKQSLVAGGAGSSRSALITGFLSQAANGGSLLPGVGICYLTTEREQLRSLVEQLPENRVGDVVLFDPSRGSGINLFDAPEGSDLPELADNIFTLIKDESAYWGPRVTIILKSLIEAFLRHDGLGVEEMYRALRDDNYLRDLAERYDIGPVTDELPLDESLAESVARRLKPFATDGMVRTAFANTERPVDLSTVVSEGGILLIDLSTVSDDYVELVSKGVLLSLWEQLHLRGDDEPPFLVGIDPLDELATQAHLLLNHQKARSRGVGYIAGIRTTEGLPKATSGAVLGNSGQVVCAQLDSLETANQLASMFDGAGRKKLLHLRKDGFYAQFSTDYGLGEFELRSVLSELPSNRSVDTLDSLLPDPS